MARLLTAGLISVAACGGEPGGPTVARAWPVMGTMMTAAVWGADTGGIDRALDQVRDSVELLDSLLSTYRDDSEISRVNRRREARSVTPHFAAVLREALAVARASGGAFDPTRRDWRGVTFDSTVQLRRGLDLDFGGIAKGYALDRTARLLEGVADSALLDLGGQFLWVGARGSRRMVGIDDPDDALRALAIVELRGGSVSTSSQAEQPGHIVDPRTGRPADGRAVRSVTVLAPNAMAADAWSTAFFVLGCDSALVLAPRLAAWRVSVVCADSAGVRWTPDLNGRVLLPSAAAGARGARGARGAPPARAP